MQLRVTFDRDADAAYIYLREIGSGGVAETIVCDDVPVNLDLDKQGHLIGIEILGATGMLPVDVIQAAEQLGR
ncbi:MAG TPA: DUF2283 domain-containing protein [Pseudonocardiaceae bacterium]|nr:DUF2283 domain-containing protein [Pseudonocardiaceae bacterium]